MEEYVTVEVHREFEKRIVEENNRQNARLKCLEDTFKEIQRLTVSVEKMAVSMENMAEELKSQGERLDAIEKEPSDNWKKLMWIIGSAIVGAVLTMVMMKIGLTV